MLHERNLTLAISRGSLRALANQRVPAAANLRRLRQSRYKLLALLLNLRSSLIEVHLELVPLLVHFLWHREPVALILLINTPDHFIDLVLYNIPRLLATIILAHPEVLPFFLFVSLWVQHRFIHHSLIIFHSFDRVRPQALTEFLNGASLVEFFDEASVVCDDVIVAT